MKSIFSLTPFFVSLVTSALMFVSPGQNAVAQSTPNSGAKPSEKPALEAVVKSNFFCTVGLTNALKTTQLQVGTGKTSELLALNDVVSVRLDISALRSLLITIYHQGKPVSQVVMKNGTQQFALSAGGVEMNCFAQAAP
jgi:hypothetical protein